MLVKIVFSLLITHESRESEGKATKIYFIALELIETNMKLIKQFVMNMKMLLSEDKASSSTEMTVDDPFSYNETRAH